MRRRRAALQIALVLGSTLVGAGPAAQAAAQPGVTSPPLALEAAIPLEGVRGRIDHMAVDLAHGRLIVAELGNDTVGVIDLAARRVIRRLTGLREPQGVGYAAKADLILVANAGDGSVRMFRGEDLAAVGSIPLGDDADNVRVDPHDGPVVVGYGRGGLAVIDPASRGRVADIRLPAHPEGFQIDPSTGRVYVNLPDAGQIAVVGLNARRVTDSWKMDAGANFPMALDPGSTLLAVAFRTPARLRLLDRDTGVVAADLAACGDADDVFFDGRRQRIYVSCGDGTLAVYGTGPVGYAPMTTVRTSPGARTSLFVPELDRLFVAVRAGRSGSGAEIRVYAPSP